MAFSTQRAVSDGTMAYLDLSIQYMKRADINVFYNGLPADPATWAWVGVTDKRIAFSPVIPNGVEVLLKRTTQINAIINVFANGAKFNNAAMDQNFTQLLYLNQEAVEGAALTDIFNDVDFHGFKIKNLGLAVDDTDAITFGQLKTMSTGAYNAQIAAEAAEAQAQEWTAVAQLWATKLDTPVQGSDYSAKQYALNSTAGATAAAGSASAAAGSASAASGSAGAASTSASAAGTARTAAEAARDLSIQWASQLTTTVDGTSYSAKQYALNASASATSAAASAAAAGSALSSFTSNILVTTATPLVTLTGTLAGSYADIRWQPAVGVLRWALRGQQTDWRLNRYDASGVLQDSPVVVTASSGLVTFADGINAGSKVVAAVATPVATTDAANKAYVDAKPVPGLVKIAGGSLVGQTVFSLSLPTGYTHYELVLDGVSGATATAESLVFQWAVGGVALSGSPAYATYHTYQVFGTAGVSGANQSTNGSGLISGGMNNAAGVYLSSTMTIFNPRDTTKRRSIVANFINQQDNARTAGTYACECVSNTSCDGMLIFLASQGAIARGTYALYGKV